ncbi:hepatocellular carcinoma-associated antigen 59-domain-containing protein [Amanita rubescens]|nr:hepatocellular carcinoma-associated antigen 59-domain-containing protein [Amanita rubescens]
MIKKRTRPQPRVRERESSPEADKDDAVPENEEEEKLPLAELIELRKLRRAREGIDVTKLQKGDGELGGLQKGVRDNDEDEMEDLTIKTRRVIRSNNFTQQTNALDVDKHMMAYIEENLKIRSRPREDDGGNGGPDDPQEELYKLSESVTTSMSMLTAIPEVDLGMDARLKNIEETEKAKRVVAEERQERRKAVANDEEHLVATRFYRPNLKAKSDADILRDAKLEAMGLPPQDDMPKKSHYEKPQMATDELVMERFKKRMRK